jgi:hypothetical protein
LCNADAASSDGAPYFLVVVTLHQMAQNPVWFWWRFIIWRTVSSGAGGTSSDVEPSFLAGDAS